jgi:hypothetical protein
MGDANEDNVLDLRDYNLILGCYLQTCERLVVKDFNDDGKVDEKDLNTFYSGLANRNGD